MSEEHPDPDASGGPEDLYYTKEHEWVRIDPDKSGAVVGITDHAQEALGEVTYVEMPTVGRQVGQFGELAVVESAKAASEIGRDFVYCLKPNPAIFAPDRFDPELARRELRRDLEPARGCVVEIVMKDVTTVRNDPARLWEWSRIALEVAEEFAP